MTRPVFRHEIDETCNSRWPLSRQEWIAQERTAPDTKAAEMAARFRPQLVREHVKRRDTRSAWEVAGAILLGFVLLGLAVLI